MSHGAMQLTWLGRSCFQVVTRDGTRVLFDPFLEWCPQPPATPDVICVSHGHLDHFVAVPDLVRGDSPTQVVAIPRLCRALRELIPETRHRLFPIAWGEQVELNWLHFWAFRSPPMRTSLYDMFEEFGVSKTLDFLNAFRQLADDILYLPLTSFGVEADGIRLLHFAFEGEAEAEAPLSTPEECATCENPCALASAWEETNPPNGADVRVCRLRFQSDVALVGVQPGEEQRSAEYAAALGASLVIPHHYRAYGKLPPADLDAFARELARLVPDTTLRVLDVMESIEI